MDGWRSDQRHGPRFLLNKVIVSSTMLKVKVDRDSPTDLYEQVAGEIRRAIAEGQYGFGSGNMKSYQNYKKVLHGLDDRKECQLALKNMGAK